MKTTKQVTKVLPIYVQLATNATWLYATVSYYWLQMLQRQFLPCFAGEWSGETHSVQYSILHWLHFNIAFLSSGILQVQTTWVKSAAFDFACNSTPSISPQAPLLVLAKTELIGVMHEKCIDVTIFLLFSSHLRSAPSGGGGLFLRGTLFSSEFCPGGHYSLGGHNSLQH